MSLARRPLTMIPKVRLQDVETFDHDLTLVIPAYNEESRLPKTLDGVKKFLDAWGLNYRVVIVDDGSHDQTASLTDSYGRRFSTICQANNGKGSAIRNGLLAAKGRIVAFTDADLPYDLAALQHAVHAIETRNRDVVFGSRTMQGALSRVERKWLRSIASSVFRSMMTMLVSDQVTDTQCGLKVFTQRAAQQIFSQTTVNGFAFDAEVVFLTHLLDLSFETVPVTLINDYSSTISLARNSIPMLWDVLSVRLRAMRGGYRTDVKAATIVPVRKSAREAA